MNGQMKKWKRQTNGLCKQAFNVSECVKKENAKVKGAEEI